MGVSLICLPFAKNIYQTIAPMGFYGITIGMVEVSMLPHLAFLADLRHNSVYGTIYALGDLAFCLAFGVGPLIAGPICEAGR
jgi:DHA1 family solute carrier family 18 vesicular amine transporter 1/2